MMFMGLPAMVVVLADNQVGVAASVASHGAGLDLGPSSRVGRERLAAAIAELSADPSRRAAMARAGQVLVDGHGAARVVGRMSP
jgi:UDP-2,4-diacetamido-2,4,6-trideoxy-beta-L-altropyranose hydrolase